MNKNKLSILSQISVIATILSAIIPNQALAAPLQSALSANLSTTTAATTVHSLVSNNTDSTNLILDTIDEGPKPDKVVQAVITAYTSTPDQTDDSPCITADGTNLCKRGTEDILAANWLPLGTKVKIPSLYGDRVFEIHDRMNKRYGYGRMDIWLNTTKNEARKFGVKRVEVEIYFISQELAKK